MRRLLLQASTILTLDDNWTTHRPGWLLLEGDRILELGEGPYRGDEPIDEIIDLGGRLIMPGLINAHTHTPMVLFRGLAEGHSLLTFEGWYQAIRVWEHVLEPDMIPAAVKVSCAEMIRTGTTCFADQYFHMDRILPAVRQSGMRAALAYGIVEMGDPESRERELANAERFLDSVHDDPRLYGWVGPHAFFVDNSPDAIELELKLARKYDTGLHIHLSTSGEEDRFCLEHFGRSAVQQMEHLGVLELPVLAAHCLTVPEEDFSTLSRYPFTAVVAASAGMRSGAGIAPLKAMRLAGINTALGTDNVTNNNSYDMFAEMGTAAKLMSLREGEPTAIPAQEILAMATRGAAQGLGLEDRIGSLQPGLQADLISLDLSAVGWAPDRAQDPYTAVVYAISGMHVQEVMVDGQWLMRDGQWLTLDYQEAVAELNHNLIQLRARRNQADQQEVL